MLGFSSLFDAHFHLFSTKNVKNVEINAEFCQKIGGGCSCGVSKDDFFTQKAFIQQNNLSSKIKLCYGIHPWYGDFSQVDFLELLLKGDEICAVGETGFDLFTPELKEKLEIQKICWNAQLELAEKYNKPVVIHCRKGLRFVVADSKKLCRLPAVVFHGFGGNVQEAQMLMSKIPQSYFSFGSGILREGSRAEAAFRELPLERLLLESDEMGIDLLGKIYEKAGVLRWEKDGMESEKILVEMKKNYKKAFVSI